MQAGDGGRRAAGAARIASGAIARPMPLSTSLRTSSRFARFSLRAVHLRDRLARARNNSLRSSGGSIVGQHTDRRLEREMLLCTATTSVRLPARSLARSRARVRVRRVYFAPLSLDARLTRASRSLSGYLTGSRIASRVYTAVAETNDRRRNPISLSHDRNAYVRASRAYKGHCAPTTAAAPPAAPRGARPY